MKRKSLLFILLLFGVYAHAQQRMKFLGQPLGCTINTFKQRMAANGYKCEGELEPYIYYFDGSFGGDEVTVGASITPRSKIVYNIAVVYDNFYSNTYDSESASTQLFKKINW